MTKSVEMKICLGSSCFSRGNKELVNLIREYIMKNHLEDRVFFKGSRCMGNCNGGPNLSIDGKLIENISASTIEEILENELTGLK